MASNVTAAPADYINLSPVCLQEKIPRMYFSSFFRGSRWDTFHEIIFVPHPFLRDCTAYIDCMQCWCRVLLFACFFFFFVCVCVKGGGVGIIWACRCTTVSCFVSVMDSQKMKGMMGAENLVSHCCLGVKKINLGCHSSRPQGTGAHMRCWGVNMLLIRSWGGCRTGSREDKSSTSALLWRGHYLTFYLNFQAQITENYRLFSCVFMSSDLLGRWRWMGFSHLIYNRCFILDISPVSTLLLVRNLSV